MNNSILFILVFCVVQTSAQKRFSEGSIRFDVTTQSLSDKSSTKANFLQQVKGSHYRSELSSELGKTTTIFDIREGAGGLLREYGAQKILIPMNAQQWDSKVSKNDDLAFYIKNEFKQILGFNCQLATSQLQDSTTLLIYFSKDIVAENKGMELQFSQLPGFVLEYISMRKDIQVSYLAKSVDFEPVPIQKFELPKSGFRILEFKETNK
jgi:GLPGLI family protein